MKLWSRLLTGGCFGCGNPVRAALGRLWCGDGAASLRHRVSVDALLPLLLVPALLLLAALNLACSFLVLVATPLFVYYANRNFLRFLMRSKFFLCWLIASVGCLMAVFELAVVPLLEILPEENYVFIAAVVGGILTARRTVKCQHSATSSQQQLFDPMRETLLDVDGSSDQAVTESHVCQTCKRRFPRKAYHCRVCQTCVPGREYHCKWLDCCIGYSNYRWYMICLFSSAVAFIYGSNLAITSVCHPFLFAFGILLPDDCSDVYFQYDMALCFVSSIYSLLIGLVLSYYFFKHLWLLAIGTTWNERKAAAAKHKNQTNQEENQRFTSHQLLL
ncbi:unnamed protein product [Trichogramma brassicae]|uniref:Palmitoyltransferase n=1 Tax=Trichogramma brassicae TaxID=86971 RepID=A0A6H5IGZ7_9HYME|nr:unnamed protein product [Trichogramma brassicae]